MTVLELARSVYDEVVTHGRSGGQREVCGVLVGDHGTDRSVATDSRRASNAAADARTRYRIDPEALLELVEAVEADGDDVVGFYHSHPAGPPRPSATDQAEATWRGYSYAICALDGEPFVGSWRWTGTRFEPETVQLVAD